MILKIMRSNAVQCSVKKSLQKNPEMLPRSTELVSFCNRTASLCMHLWVLHFTSYSVWRYFSLNHHGDSLHSIFPQSSGLNVGLLVPYINEQCRYSRPVSAAWFMNSKLKSFGVLLMFLGPLVKMQAFVSNTHFLRHFLLLWPLFCCCVLLFFFSLADQLSISQACSFA